MAKFLLAYKGGGMPETPEAQAQVMTAWEAWFTAAGGAVADPGNPSSKSRTVAADGTAGPAGPASLSGYTILNADSLDAAVALARTCPVLAGGASIEVIETFDVM